MKRTILVATALVALCLALPWTFEGPGPAEVPSNAVVLYERASASLSDVDDAVLEELGEVLDHGWHGAHASLDRYLEENRTALSWIERGSRVPRSDFLKGAASPGGRAALTGVPPRGLDMRSVRRFADLLLLEAARHHARGEDDEALENYVALLRMSEHYAHDRNVNLMSATIAVYLRGLAVQPIAQLLHRPKLDEKEWRELLAFLQQSSAPVDLERAFVNDITTLRQLCAEEEWELDADNLARFHAELERLGDEFVEHFRVARDTGDFEPYQTAMELLLTDAELAADGPGSMARAALVMGLPNIESMLTRERVEEARIAMLVVFVAAELHRLEYDRTLDSLDELVPEFLPAVPRDPFAADGAPLRLARNGRNRWFYSVGPDGLDQEGQVVLPDGALRGEGDLVVASRHDHH